MLSRLTIRLRIILAFALVLVATTGLGIFAMQRLDAVKATADDLGTNWLPAANSLGDLNRDFEVFRSRQGQTLLLTGAERAAYFEKQNESMAAIRKDLAAYETTVTTDEERKIAVPMRRSIEAYLGLHQGYLDLVAAENIPAATAYYIEHVRSAVDTARADLKTVRQYQVDQGAVAVAQAQKVGKDATTLITIALGITAFACFGIGFIMIRSISVPISFMSSVMRQLAGGDVAVKIPNLGETNEIGDMAKAVEVFKDGMIRNRQLEADAAQAREDAEALRKKTMRDLADQFEASVGGIVEMVSSAAVEMQATAQQLTSSAQEASAQAVSVSAAAEEAGTNVTSVAGSAEELGASVAEISRQVEHSSQKARDAVTEADATAAIVQELSEAAGRINGIVEMISGIASQTNLLALNATIESARAGEAGKGFAVVASEVKTLAGQTTKATADINAQITAIQATTKQAVLAIENITGTIRDINDFSSNIASAVEQQGAATNEIVQAVNQASIGTAEVTSSITGVAQMAEETGAGASQVLSASSELAHQADQLRRQVQSFLSTVRAA